MINVVAASHDAAAFPNPEAVDLDRPVDSYVTWGWGPHQCLGLDMCRTGLTTMLKTVAKLEGLRRAPGPQGRLKTIKVEHGFSLYLTADGSSYFPFPQTLRVCFDGEIPAGKGGKKE